ncbi:MAG: GspH/FimT family pseudopilin [Neisseria sp.]|nr:GspH/FimT family pseudopilin [Neisseria sp.]
MDFVKLNRKQTGFTLIELMIGVTLLAIFATLAVPAMGDMIARQRVKSDAATLASAFTFAQSEAIRLNAPVYVVPGKIKVDGKLDGEEKKGWGDAKAILIHYDKDRDNKYSSGDSIRVGTISPKSTLAIEARTYVKPESKDAAYTLPGFVFLNTGLMRTKKDFTTAGMGDVGLMGRIVVTDQGKPGKHCRVVRVEAGRARMCSDQESRNKDDKFCYCQS